MNKRSIFLLIVSHGLVGAIGFAVGIYMLPILIAPPAPSTSMVQTMSSQALYRAQFRKDLKDSDTFHWGKGTVSIGKDVITLQGELAPGPDYKLYLSPVFVETESGFNMHKTRMLRVGDVKTFENFVVELGEGIDPTKYNSVIVWCETFGEFITSAKYR